MSYSGKIRLAFALHDIYKTMDELSWQDWSCMIFSRLELNYHAKVCLVFVLHHINKIMDQLSWKDMSCIIFIRSYGYIPYTC